MLNFGERIAVLRRRRGFTQVELGKLVGITANTLARVERGSVKMLRGDTVAALADALGTTADYLLGRTMEPGRKPPELLEELLPADAALAGT